jgi:uncharacterized protein YhfF
MARSAGLKAFWSDFVLATPIADGRRYCETFFFGDGEAIATELAEPVLLGTKRATAGSLCSYEAEKQPRLEFFARDCSRMGRQFTEKMPVVCERFSVVYRSATRDA